MGAWSSVSLAFEFSPGVWTDVTSHLAFEAAQVVVRQGRPTELDDPSAGTLSFALYNDSGEWIPGNPTSPRSPAWHKGTRVRWRVTKGGTTHTRFVGWVTAIEPSFPTSSTIGSIVTVTAVDALGKLAQRRLRSNLTETVLAMARGLACSVDAYEADSETTGNVALMTQRSTDAAAGQPSTAWGGMPNLSFGTDRDVSFGGVVTCQGPDSNKTICDVQASPKVLWLHVKTPAQQLGALAIVTSFHTAPGGASALCHLGFAPNGSGGNDLVVRNAGNTANLAIVGAVGPGYWIRVLVKVSGSPTSSDWSFDRQDASAGFVATAAVDLRTVRAVEFPTAIGPTVSTSWGGVGALGATSAGASAADSFTAASQGTLASRIADLGTVLSQLPVTLTTTGTLTGIVATGTWSGRTALEVLQEMVRTHSALAWARSRDSVVYAVGEDQLWPASPVATIDTDADCLGAPRLVDGAESRPTRIDVDWLGGVTSLIDDAAEASGESRARRVTTIALDGPTAAAAGMDIITRAMTAPGLRISQVEVDLLGGATDHTAALFSEASTLGGLFPTQRVRLTVPASHFGSSTVDVHVQGWTETYGPEVSTVRLDTSPASTGSLLTGITVVNGSATITSSVGVFSPTDVGLGIDGPGIPEGSTIEGYVSPTEVTISSPATDSQSGAWVVVTRKNIAVDWWGGADGAAWSARWVAGMAGPGSSATIQSGRGRISAGSGVNTGLARRLSGVTFTDGEIVCSVTANQAAGNAYISYRTDTGTGRVSCYYVGLGAGSSTFFLGRSAASVPSLLATWSFGFAAGVQYRIRIRAIGSSHKARIWVASQPEPSGWHINLTDATYASGALGLAGDNGPSITGDTFDFDDFLAIKEG